MKKLLLASLISGAVLLSACDDKSAETVKQQTQQIAELTEQLKQAQENQAIIPNNEDIFVRKERFMVKDEGAKEASDRAVGVTVRTQATNYPWLNKLLFDYLAAQVSDESDIEPNTKPKKIETPEQLIKALEKIYAEGVKMVKEEGAFGYDYLSTINFVSQRHNIATFYNDYYVYGGGAHGLGNNEYIVVDLAAQKRLTVQDLFNKEQLEKIKEILWQQNVDTRGKEDAESFMPKADFYVSENFYLDGSGVHFLYDHYVLGPYAEGQPELTIYWSQLVLDKLIDPKWSPMIFTENDYH